jgi:hypothetical protein
LVDHSATNAKVLFALFTFTMNDFRIYQHDFASGFLPPVTSTAMRMLLPICGAVK